MKMVKHNFFRHLMIVGLVTMALLTSCSPAKKKNNEDVSDNVYQASQAKLQNIETELVLPGELEGYYETAIVAKVDGYIKQMYVDIGDRVKKGELLAELEAPEIVSQMAAAFSEYEAKKAMYLNTKGKLVRLAQTNKTSGAVSPYDMDLAKATLASDSLGLFAAKAKYESVKELFNYLKMTAPFDGIITERSLSPGSFVGPNDKQNSTLLKLKSEGKLRLHIAVPEKHLAEINVGNTVTFQVKSFPDETFEGKIARTSQNVNIQTRSEIIEIEIPNKDGRLLPGMYATATIPLKRAKPTVVVPSTAIVTNMERNFVIKIVQGNRVNYVDVEKGEQRGDMVEVFGKISAGDTILNSGSDEIKNNTNIKTILVANADK